MPQSHRHDTGPKQGPGDDNQDRGTGVVWERAIRPRPRRAVTHLGLVSISQPYFRKQARAAHVTTLRISTNPRSPCRRQAVAPPPSVDLARGQAPPSSITAQWKPLVLPGGGRASDWNQSCVADGRHAPVGRKFLVTSVWLTC